MVLARVEKPRNPMFQRQNITSPSAIRPVAKPRSLEFFQMSIDFVLTKY
ncbi:MULTISPECIES: hypothetical protein [unclassified Microcoleus]|nr:MULTISPECIES: hypothetical protein [unclassified Microcoleus]MCC3441027.1 hypothetical protein [Microcoleus sp. PH2017_03_ELD_O_A]MCC3466156.1 hypothetical protein [Microcoleus sp. PH2017_06_SFM_O_A]MCC3501798.1 hypothetical protein [Microcoleus sp. PH2017_19_SFW_U_A]MCC3520660.1 hypothetical protein [Microcoleus sp. PH2017_20_SFW_D_A]MCC3549468.1 hypothetical protein [Microcoleus sp. PH2017_24_DOB_U_A]MCC3625232.1 hypothetical protein [Microcoleus sp. PH2017_36_ELK_O_B]